MSDDKLDQLEKPKKKVGRPTREEAARKAASRPGRKKGSKNKSSKLKENEAKEKLLLQITNGINTLATLCMSAQSETVRANCAKWLVEMGLEIYSEQAPANKSSTEDKKEGELEKPQGKVFPFAVK